MNHVLTVSLLPREIDGSLKWTAHPQNAVLPNGVLPERKVALWLPQLPHRLGLNLPDALPCHLEDNPNLLQRLRISHASAQAAY